VEEEEEFVDGEFQEADFIDEEFEPKGVEDEDPSQELVDWDTPPVYDDDINEEEPIEEPLASDLEEVFEEYGLHTIFNGLYPDEDGQLEDEEPTNGIVDEETHWKMESPRMTSPIVKKMTSPIIKRLSMLISLVLKIF
jgi:hypothetical protein